MYTLNKPIKQRDAGGAIGHLWVGLRHQAIACAMLAAVALGSAAGGASGSTAVSASQVNAQSLLDHSYRGLFRLKTDRVHSTSTFICDCGARRLAFRLRSTVTEVLGKRVVWEIDDARYTNHATGARFPVVQIDAQGGRATRIAGRWFCSPELGERELRRKLPPWLFWAITLRSGLAVVPTPRLERIAAIRGRPVYIVRSYGGASLRGRSVTTYFVDVRDYLLRRLSLHTITRMPDGGLLDVRTRTNFSNYGTPARVALPRVCEARPRFHR